MPDVGSVLNLFGGLLVMALILVLAYYGSRGIGKTFQIRNTGKNIRIVETVPVAQGTCLAIACVGKKYYLLSVAAGKVELLQELPEAFTPEETAESVPPFKVWMGKIAEKTREEKQ